MSVTIDEEHEAVPRERELECASQHDEGIGSQASLILRLGQLGGKATPRDLFGIEDGEHVGGTLSELPVYKQFRRMIGTRPSVTLDGKTRQLPLIEMVEDGGVHYYQLTEMGLAVHNALAREQDPSAAVLPSAPLIQSISLTQKKA